MVNETISVIIVSYNSAGFIIETLESIAKQTYRDIELIITDDNSFDDTVEISRKWIEENKERFLRTEILTSAKNTGVTGNANRGLLAAKGNWLKFLGADDTLKPSCIEDNMSWIALNPDIKVLFSQVEIYRDNFKTENLIKITPVLPITPESIMSEKRDAQSQHRMLLLQDRIHFSPSVFIHRNTILSLGGFNENFRSIEDYPLWLKLTGNGYKLHFMNKITVNYRQHSQAVNNTGDDYIINPNYFKLESFRRQHTYPNIPPDLRLSQKFDWFVSQIFRLKMFNQRSIFNEILFSLFTVYINPFKYLIWIRKHLDKKLKKNDYYQ